MLFWLQKNGIDFDFDTNLKHYINHHITTNNDNKTVQPNFIYFQASIDNGAPEDVRNRKNDPSLHTSIENSLLFVKCFLFTRLENTFNLTFYFVVFVFFYWLIHDVILFIIIFIDTSEEHHKGKVTIPDTKVGEEGSSKRNIQRKHDHDPNRKSKPQHGGAGGKGKWNDIDDGTYEEDEPVQ
jgi:hypothetical protein